jgi:hypothetical protein
MFGGFSRQYWKRNSTRKRRSPFGGTVKSMEEVNELSRKILAHEEKEAKVADQMLDSEWEKVEKKQKS